MEEIKECVGTSCDSYEGQFRALLIAIEAGQPSKAKSTLKKERELKHLFCLINYNARGGNAFRDKGKGRVANSN